MNTLNLNSSIEQLFENDLIDGETYLFCLDNNFNKFETVYEIFVQDNFFDGLNNCNFIVKEELIRICEIHKKNETDQIICLDSEISNNTSIDTALIESQNRPFDLEISYQTLKMELSRRAINILEQLERKLKYPNNTFFKYLLCLKNPYEEFLSLKNAGKNSVTEMVNLVNVINKQIDSFSNGSITEFKLIKEVHIENEIEKGKYQILLEKFNYEQQKVLENHFFNEVNKLSTRSINRIYEFFKLNDNSIIELCIELTMPNFNWCDVKNIGRKSLVELDELSVFLIKLITEISKEGVSDYNIDFDILFIQKELNVNVDFATEIYTFKKNQNHFPFFRIIKSLLTTKGRDWVIINNTIKIFNKQSLVTLNDLAPTLEITRERVRQRRMSILKSFEVDIKSLANNELIDILIYKIYTEISLDTNKIDYLNKLESVDFNINFVYYILSILYSDSFVLFGDINKAFLEVYDEEVENLILIPKVLFDIFNFEQLLIEFKSKLNDIVYENYSIQMESFILLFFKDQIYIDKLSAILNLCQVIFYRRFGILTENDGSIIIPKNANKNLPDIAEDVLRKVMRQMSLDEIFDEIENLFPGLCKSSFSLRGSLLRNKNIIPIGRDSVYVLKEWHELGIGIKGGTIRDLVAELLLTSDLPLSIDDITKYVVEHRNETDSYSIYNNLRLDKSKQFVFFDAFNQRFIGLASKEYSLSLFEATDFKYVERKDFKDRLLEIEEFIKTNNRFPFSSTDDKNEESMYRFMNIQRGKIKKGALSVEQLNDIEIFEKKYGSFEMSKRDFEWDINFNQIKDYITLNGYFPTVKANSLLYGWLQRQRRFIREDKLSEYQIEKLKTLYNNELDA